MPALTTEADIARLERKLDSFARAVRHPTQANREASIALYGVTIRNFDKQGADFGAWAPLAAITIAEKARIGKEVPLVRTGHLRMGFTPFYSDDNAGVRNAVEYAAAQHEGVPSRNLPARNLLPTRPAVLDIGIKIYGRWIEKQAKAANA